MSELARIDRRKVMLAAGGAVLGVATLGKHVEIVAQDAISATLVTDTAGIGDQSFNDLADRGGKRAAEELGVEWNVLESQTSADYVTNLTLASEESKAVIPNGFLLGDAVNEVAPMFPDVSYVFIDAVAEQPNVSSVLFKENEGAFLGGILAGLATTTGKVGMVGGQDIPPVERYEVGFAAGVMTINPTAVFTPSYANDFEDPGLGKELTNALYNADNDIVLQAAGRTGVGCFDAAKEKGPGFWVIAGDTDQAHLGPDNQLAVVRKGVDTAVFSGIQSVIDGTFAGGILSLGLAEDGMDLSGLHASIDPAFVEVVAQYKQAIIDGTIVVPASRDELAAFVPVVLDGTAAPSASPVASPAS